MKKKPQKNTIEDLSLADINRYELDVEWVNQPKMIKYYGELLAQAKYEVVEAKIELDVLRAEVSKKVRSRPGKYGIEKITEGVVENEIILQLREHPAQKKLLDANHKVNMLQVAMTTLDNRKKALSDLVFLHSIQYFAEPKAPKGEAAKKAIEDMKENRVYKRNRERYYEED